MSEESRNRRKSSLPAAAILAAAFILLFELFVSVNRSHFVDGIEANLISKRALLEDMQRHDDVAIFGDSKVFSIRPDTVAAALGDSSLRVTNYSWPFMGVEAYEAMLTNYLRHKPAPQAIIVNAGPELIGLPSGKISMMAEPSHRARAFVALPLRQIVNIAAETGQWSLIWHRATHALLPPSAVHKESVLPALKDLLRGRGWPELEDDYVRMTASFAETGAFLMHKTREVSAAEVIDLERHLGPYAIHRNYSQVASFERFLARAAKAGSTVLMMGTPAPPQYHKRFSDSGVYTAYLYVLDHWKRQYKNLHILNALFPVYALENFGDAGHLNGAGDKLFQADYAAQLRRESQNITIH